MKIGPDTNTAEKFREVEKWEKMFSEFDTDPD